MMTSTNTQTSTEIKPGFIALTGDTYRLREKIAADGWRWSGRVWYKNVGAEEADAIIAGGKPEVDRIGGNYRACRVVVIASDFRPVEVWRSKHYTEPARADTRMGACSACGDWVPLTRTPKGWLCADCCEEEAR